MPAGGEAGPVLHPAQDVVHGHLYSVHSTLYSVVHIHNHLGSLGLALAARHYHQVVVGADGAGLSGGFIMVGRL